MVVVLGLIALPALADNGTGTGWAAQMRTLMNQTFTPAQQQQFMNSSAMQSLHNSPEMQEAMQSGDFGSMQSLMNSDQEVKSQIGAQNVAKMNQMMGQLQGSNMSTR